MSRLTEHLRACMQRSKGFFGGLAAGVAQAAADALIEHDSDTEKHVSKQDRERWNAGNGSGNSVMVIAIRERDPGKPDFGIGSAIMKVSDYTGNTEVGAVINGVVYDAENISQNADNASNGTLIINKI